MLPDFSLWQNEDNLYGSKTAVSAYTGSRVRRPAAAVLDDAGQYVADAGPTPSVTEARDSDAAT